MGVTTAWLVTPHEDDVVAEVAPRLLPLVTAQRELTASQEQWRRWAKRPLPDWRSWSSPTRTAEEREAVESFRRLTEACPLDALYSGYDDFCVMEDVWGRAADGVAPYAGVYAKEYAVSALFHALGPRRAALLPGWCGDFVLSADEVRATLPRVEAAFGFTEGQRAAAEAAVWLDDTGAESVLDGPLRCWREAAEAGLGLCGSALHVY